jgi:hypothetical protein
VPEENLEIVDLAALLHDIDDWKYQTEDVKTKRAVQFLESQQVPSEKVARVMAIIDNMGFKEELGGNKVCTCSGASTQRLHKASSFYVFPHSYSPVARDHS